MARSLAGTNASLQAGGLMWARATAQVTNSSSLSPSLPKRAQLGSNDLNSVGVAWVAIVMPPSAGLVVLGAMLIACYAVDRRLYVAHGLRRWLVLRFRLSAVAALCCFLGAAGS